MVDLRDHLGGQEIEQPGFLMIISGPSGAGKSTVLRSIMKTRADIFFSVSATTRPPREGEENGIDYYFCTPEEFVEARDDGQFLEWAEFAGNYYGTLRGPVEEQIKKGYVVVLDIETKGAMQVMENCADAVSVFLTPSSIAEVEFRLRNRGTETEERIRRRMFFNMEGYRHIGRYDYIVINDTLRTAIAQIEAILLAEQSRAARLPELIHMFKPENQKQEEI